MVLLVKPLCGVTSVKARVNSPILYHVADPKPGDLATSRVNPSERT